MTEWQNKKTENTAEQKNKYRRFIPKREVPAYDKFGTSCVPNLCPIVWRVPILLWALGVIIWSAATFWGTLDKFLLYMTHWGLFLIVIETSLGIFVALKNSYGKYNDGTFGLPWYVKVYWMLYNITIPVAFLITVFYWCILRRSSKKVNYTPDPILDLMLHGVNSAVMMVELLLSGHPSRLLHIMQPLFFALVYLLFTLFYYGVGGLDPWGNAFIYPVVDWSKPDKTIVIALLTGAFLALMHLVTVALATIRDLIAKKLRRESTGIYNEGFTA